MDVINLGSYPFEAISFSTKISRSLFHIYFSIFRPVFILSHSISDVNKKILDYSDPIYYSYEYLNYYKRPLFPVHAHDKPQ